MNSNTSTDADHAASRETYFLPAERETREEVLRQHALLSRDPLVRELLDASLSLTMVLNSRRQAVLINEAFRERLGLRDGAEAVGSRLGDYLNCRWAAASPGGCGTTAACLNCGAARATAAAQAGKPSEKPCRIQTVVCGRDLCLNARAAPFSYRDENFLVMSAIDVAGEVRRRELEQIFFHDVLNTASGVQGLIHFMHETQGESVLTDCLPIARRASDTLIEELLSQRDLATAENGELKVSRREVASLRLLAQLAGMFESHPLAKERRVIVAPGSEGLTLTTDETLLSRVLVNLIKNALEAAPAGSTVTVSCRREGGSAAFLVHNTGFMPPEIRHQVFQRSFSTKGAGRGLGTYSIRLLTENYLGGTVGFSSDPANGTTFRAAYPLAPVGGSGERPARINSASRGGTA